MRSYRVKLPIVFAALSVAAVAVGPSGTQWDEESTGQREIEAATQAPLPEPEPPPDLSTPPFEEQRRLEEALLETAPAADVFRGRRATVVARAKAEPVYFVRTPAYSSEASKGVLFYRQRLTATDFPWETLRDFLPYFAQRPDIGRKVLLRDGYLFAEDEKLAYALVTLVRPDHLFDAPRIWVERGQQLMHAKRERGSYVYTTGPFVGERVRLLHLDRVGEGDAPSEPALHRDFRAPRLELGFNRVRVRRVSDQRLVADLRYGDSLWIPSVLVSDGPRLSLETEVVSPGELNRLTELRALAGRHNRRTTALQATILQQVAEKLPFDEPRTEFGQEDGRLRDAWRRAYERGGTRYKVNGDRYRVFDKKGRPIVPQVCIDFVVDTFERTGGTWWADKGQKPERVVGRIDFETLLPRFELRRAKTFVELAKSRSDWFDVYELSYSERWALGQKDQFFDYLSTYADRFQTGDVIVIRGKTPWDVREEHTHAFFVYETDPITGVPVAIAGNANVPAIWSLESEARRTPLRSIHYRIRPKPALLDRLTGESEHTLLEPAPLVPD